VSYVITKVRSYGDTNESMTENTDFHGVVATIRLHILLNGPRVYAHGPIRLSITMEGELLQAPGAAPTLQGEHLQGDGDW
jgi:hypothetical protein